MRAIQLTLPGLTETDDERLRRLIIDHIENDETFLIRGELTTLIVVEVYEGYVTLSGLVRSDAERRRADMLARALGALGVHNRLHLEADVSRRRA